MARRSQDPPEGRSPGEAPQSPEISSSAHLDTLAPRAAQELAEWLSKHGIEPSLSPRPRADVPTTVRRSVGRARVYVYVSSQDLEVARQLQSRLIRASLADLPPDFDPEHLSPESCPGCGHALHPEALECSECGLALPGVQDETPEVPQIGSASVGSAVGSLFTSLKRLFTPARNPARKE